MYHAKRHVPTFLGPKDLTLREWYKISPVTRLGYLIAGSKKRKKHNLGRCTNGGELGREGGGAITTTTP